MKFFNWEYFYKKKYSYEMFCFLLYFYYPVKSFELKFTKACLHNNEHAVISNFKLTTVSIIGTIRMKSTMCGDTNISHFYNICLDVTF